MFASFKAKVQNKVSGVQIIIKRIIVPKIINASKAKLDLNLYSKSIYIVLAIIPVVSHTKKIGKLKSEKLKN